MRQAVPKYQLLPHALSPLTLSVSLSLLTLSLCLQFHISLAIYLRWLCGSLGPKLQVAKSNCSAKCVCVRVCCEKWSKQRVCVPLSALALKRFATNVAMRQQKSQKKSQKKTRKKPVKILVKLKVSHSQSTSRAGSATQGRIMGRARGMAELGAGGELILLGQLSEQSAALSHKPKIAFSLSEQIQHFLCHLTCVSVAFPFSIFAN